MARSGYWWKKGRFWSIRCIGLLLCVRVSVAPRPYLLQREPRTPALSNIQAPADQQHQQPQTDVAHPSPSESTSPKQESRQEVVAAAAAAATKEEPHKLPNIEPSIAFVPPPPSLTPDLGGPGNATSPGKDDDENKESQAATKDKDEDMDELESKKSMYELDSQRGTFFEMPEGDALIDGKMESFAIEGQDGITDVMRGGKKLALKSVKAAVTALARQAISTVARKKGIGAAAITSPAVVAITRPTLATSRALFTAVKRISALNVDFNLPISCFDRFGSSISVIIPMGDLDSDLSTMEIAVGAPGDRTHAKGAGAVYILSLANFGTIIRNYHKIIPGEGVLAEECFAHAAFGTGVASIGDLNHDGWADIAVGAPFEDLTGVVFILFLGCGGEVQGYSKIGAMFGPKEAPYPSPLQAGDEFGCSVANIGDLNGDGIPDLAVGACGDSDVKKGGVYPSKAACAGAGAVYILFMDCNGAVKHHKKISALSGNLLLGPRPGDRFGASITLIGDVNGDGCPEIAVGAPLASASSKHVGELYILELLPTGDVKRVQIIGTSYVPTDQFGRIYLNAPLAANDYWGSSVAALDVNRDGCLDLLVGSRGFNQLYQDEGGAFACYMNAGGTGLIGWERVASQTGLTVPCSPGEQFGAAMAVFNDCTGAANAFTPDLLFVGAPGEPLGTCQGGSVYVIRVQPL